MLYDCFSECPVIIAKKKYIHNSAIPNFSFAGGEKGLKQLDGSVNLPENLKGFRLIPYCVVGSKGVLPAFKPDGVVISDGKTEYKPDCCLVALSDEQTGEWEALLGKNIFERTVSRDKISEKTADYIFGPTTLPPPLSKEQESEAMDRLKSGDESVRQELIVHNLRLVVYIARKFDVAGAGIEDIISIGTIGLIKAVKTFSPEKNIKLATYASRCIENEILMYIRKTSQIKGELSLDEPLNTDWDGNELLLSDVLGSDPDTVGLNVEKDDECKMLKAVLEKLPSRDKKIMYMRFGLDGQEEHTQKQVADMLDISQSYISRLEKKIILSLKKELQNI